MRAPGPSRAGATRPVPTAAALPDVVCHADWSMTPAKRWVAEARLRPGGRYAAAAPRRAGKATGLHKVFGLGGDAAPTVLLGFDFAIGLPLAYADKAGIEDFRASLPSFGSGRWASFFVPARDAGEISLERPFFPAGVAAAGNAARLQAALGLEPGELLRRCDLAHKNRRAAAALFLTQGQQQVGKASIVGWRDVLQPSLGALRDVDPRVLLWPFDGTLPELLERGGVVVAETYPAELYGHLGLTMGSGGRKGHQEVRSAQAPALVRWAEASGVELTSDLRAAIEDGFGGAAGDDRFDAVVGLFGMLNVLLGERPVFEPEDARIRRIEGWMLGLEVSPARPGPSTAQVIASSPPR